MELKIDRTYYKNGQIREEYHAVGNQLHREDGPAYIWYYENGDIREKTYYLNDKWHRENGPAFIRYHRNGKLQTEYYFLNDEPHREDGPADIYYNEDGRIINKKYYLNGYEIIDELQLLVIQGLEMEKNYDIRIFTGRNNKNDLHRADQSR